MRLIAAEAGANNMWRNDLAQSVFVQPGDTINVEAAMMQSGITDDQVEFLGPSDNLVVPVVWLLLCAELIFEASFQKYCFYNNNFKLLIL